MASCLTLKRPLEHDLQYDHPSSRTPSPVSKRRRCYPMTIVQQQQPQSSNSSSLSVGDRAGIDSPTTDNICSNQSSSPFPDVQPILNTDALLTRLKEEVRRLHRRHQLKSSSSYSYMPVQQPSSPSSELSEEENSNNGGGITDTTSLTSMTGSSTTSKQQQQQRTSHQQPLLSLKQVHEICARLLKEREDKVREEYDRLLSMKLNEQHESFVRFMQEQMTRRFSELQFSYVS